ncbi:MAG: PilW family protein [Burkholderiales bacterium]|nr:PilW family protein [Burkholderiales bacterium]
MKNIPRARTFGFTLVEILVALLIGMLSVYAVYSVYARFDQSNRVTTSVNETQLSGLHSIFLLEQIASDAGSSMMNRDVFNELSKCRSASSVTLSDDISIIKFLANSVFPLPTLISSQLNGEGNRADSLFLYSGKSSRYLSAISDLGLLNNGYNTFSLPVAFRQGDVLIQLSDDNCGGWAAFDVQDSTQANTTLSPLVGNGAPGGGKVINLGNAERHHFYVDPQGSLLMDQYAVGSTVPSSSSIIASNVKVFAAQYGIDTNADNAIDYWVDGWQDNSGRTPGNTVWSPANVLNFEANSVEAQKQRLVKAVKAIRIGVVVEVDQPEHDPERNPALVTAQADLTLFAECAPNNATCPPAITFTPSAPQNSILKRYRAYETIIPLHNVVWNPINAIRGNT